MKECMATNHETCFAVPARARALTALVVPIFVVGYTIISLSIKGYAPLDYPYLVTSGQLDVPTLIIGLSALTIWVLRYCPPAHGPYEHHVLFAAWKIEFGSVRV